MGWEEFDRKVQVAASHIDALRQSAGKSSSQRAALPKAIGKLQVALEALQAAGEELHQARGELETRGQERTAEPARANQALQAGVSERSRMEVQLSARNRELLTLHRLSEIFIRTPSLEAACREIVEEIGAATGFPCLAIELYDEARQKMIFKAIKGIPLPPGQETLEVPVEETLSGIVARTGRPVIETNAGKRAEYANEILRQIKARTFICLPMIVDGRVVGTLSLAHPKAVRVDERLTEWLESLANCVAALIEHKRVEQERRQLAAVVESSDDAIIGKNLDGIIISWNQGAERLYGYQAEEVIGQPISILAPPDRPDETLCLLARLKQGEPIAHLETVRVRKDGTRLDVSVNISPIKDAEGRIIGASAITRDITGRKRAEEALRTSQAQMAGIIASAMDAIIAVDADQKITLFNAAAEKMFRCSAAEAIGQPLDRVIPERFRAAHREHIRAFGETQVTRRSMGALGGLWGVRADGEEFPIEASISQIAVEGQKFFTAILRDITKRKRAEERLIEQAALLDHAQDAILVRSLENRVLFWNRGAERLYGWTVEEAVGRPCRDFIYPKGSSQLEEATQTVIEQGEWVGELHQTTKDSKEIVVEGHWTLVRDESGQPKAILAINTDITEKKTLEAQLRRAQRLESIGTLAGGIAHDLNNILSPILMGIHMLQEKNPDEESQRWLGTMRTSAMRGSDLVKQVLTFARGAEGQRIKLSPKYLMKDLVLMLQDTLPKSIEVSYSVPNDVWPVMGDATQLYQLLMNLCLNARDAMPGGGRLQIKAENTRLDETYARMRFNAEPGRFVLITIADTGAGIPPEVRDKIFDPFFTTKEIGRGTGLGLSTVLGIVKSHGGLIDVASKVGKGSAFKVYLPAVETGQLVEAEERLAELPGGHGELILVIDDEKAILEITRGALEAHDYAVLTADNGVEAVALCAEHKGRVQAVLIDMMMPLMDGPATIRALRRLDPYLKIIATSGVPGEEKKTEAASAGAQAFLPKPYTAGQLLNILAEALAAKVQGRAI
jgi:PAS domain S-box-containing protein